jgi:uracil phosphoribosyltransferase
VEVLITKGLKQQNIIFVNLVSCPEGIEAFHQRYPEIKIVTGMIDKGLNDQKFILPGLGDFGCRYFGTD